jgi:hypothetical protein
VVLRRPQGVVAQLVHELRDLDHGAVGLDEALVRVAPRVGGRAGLADVVELDLADEEHGELVDHRASIARRVWEPLTRF